MIVCQANELESSYTNVQFETKYGISFQFERNIIHLSLYRWQILGLVETCFLTSFNTPLLASDS